MAILDPIWNLDHSFATPTSFWPFRIQTSPDFRSPLLVVHCNYSRHSVNGPSVTGIIQLTDFYQSGNWMVELAIYGPIDHSVTELFVR